MGLFDFLKPKTPSSPAGAPAGRPAQPSGVQIANLIEVRHEPSGDLVVASETYFPVTRIGLVVQGQVRSHLREGDRVSVARAGKTESMTFSAAEEPGAGTAPEAAPPFTGGLMFRADMRLIDALLA